MTAVPGSVRRIGLVAHNTLREAVRQRLFQFLVLLAGLLVLGAQFLREFNFGVPELKFIADLGLAVIGLLGAVLTVTATVQLFFTELENRTVLTLLAKPVTRTEFVLGKFLGASGVTVVFCASQTLLLAAVLWSREVALMRQHPEVFAHGHVINYTWLAQCGGLLWLKLAVLGALTLLVVSYAGTALFAMVTGALIYLCGHLQSFALEAAARAGSAFTRTAAGIAGRILPDFQLFQMPEAGGGFPPGIAAYALGYIAAACTLAAFSFARREL